MYMDQISISFISREINMHILSGSNVKDVIKQTQNSLGLSMIPYYLSNDWYYIQKYSNVIRIKYNIDLDNIYSKNYFLSKYFNFNYNKSERKKRIKLILFF